MSNVCRDCEEGKHGACIGTTYIEVEREFAVGRGGGQIDIYEVECDCDYYKHYYCGRLNDV